MSYKLANIEGRAALVVDNNYYDLETISNGKFDKNTSNALSDLKGLSEINKSLSQAKPTGSLKDVKLDSPV